MESKILQGLNKAQYDAVVNYDSPSLIIAGAGSGKTRVLTSRIAYMLEQGVKPWNILALTFTNKAARQMRERIEQMVEGSASHYIRMGTFHSVFSRILRENAERIGYPQTFTIYEPNDCKNLIKAICKERNLADDKYKPARVLSRISYAKNALITPGAYVANTSFAAEDRQMQMPQFGEIYVEYCRRCKANGAMDFDDLLLQTNILLRDCPDVLTKYQEQFQYILVDEYQDTNYAQYIIIRRLSQLHGRVCVVGDDAQSIYSFRGAKIENILSFRNDYPSAQTFKLEQNYRSTQTIVNAANSVIEHNSRRMEKKCFSEGDGGEKILIRRYVDGKDEAQNIATEIRIQQRATGDSWGEFAVLYRTNIQAKDLEDAFSLRGIPYKVYGSLPFYQIKEIKDVIAYMRVVVNPNDDEAFKRVVNYPARGIGDTSVQYIAQLAEAKGCSMLSVSNWMVDNIEELTDKTYKAVARKISSFVALIRSLKQSLNEKELVFWLQDLILTTGIQAIYQKLQQSCDLEEKREGEDALNNFDKLLGSVENAKEEVDAEIRNGMRDESNQLTLEEWMQGQMLMTDVDDADANDNDSDKVTLMTVHSSKGLEYKYVYITGCEENLFPSLRALESPDGIEEERRLFYVALTRAKNKLLLSHCEMRRLYREVEFRYPSCFLREIDENYVDSDIDLKKQSQWRREPSEEGFTGRMGNFQRGGVSRGSSRGEERRDGRTAIEALRQQFDYRFQKKREEEKRKPDPRLVAPVKPRSTEGMRRVESAPTGSSASVGACAYAVGERVEHPTFGAGEVVRIESLATDYKIVVNFSGSEKTLLAKFAKLKKL